MSLEEFSEEARRRNIDEATLFDMLTNSGWTRDNKTIPITEKRSPVQIPVQGDMRPSYMRPLGEYRPYVPPAATQDSQVVPQAKATTSQDETPSSYSTWANAPLYNWLAPARNAIRRAYDSDYLPVLNGEDEPSAIAQQDDNHNTGAVSDFLNSLDIHKPIFGGAITQNTLPQEQTTSNDVRFAPIFNNNVADSFASLGFTAGDYSSSIPNSYLDKNRRNSIPDLQTGYRRGNVDTAPWSFADFLSSLRNNNTNSPDRETLIQRFLNHPAFPSSFLGLDYSLFWPQVMNFPVRNYPYK